MVKISSAFRRFVSVIRITGVALIIFATPLRAQLIINEVSQGASGTKEYVELLTVGTPGCSAVPCVDLRGWYIDDNNGNHATGVGTGIAPGCIHLTNDPLWSCVPIGTLIVIYNDADLNPSIPAQDLSLSDGNCTLVIPVSNCTLIEKHSSNPSTATPVYPTVGFTSCGLWSTVSMANTDDSFQTIDPSGNLVFSVSWGNNTLNDIIYFAGSSAGMVAWMNNASNNIPSNQANWTRTAVAGTETPGAPNNAANAAWIASMNNNCSAIVPLTVGATSTDANSCSCNGTATATPSGSIGPYTFSWAPTGGTSATANNLCAGTYTVTVTSATACSQTQTVTVNAGPALAVSFVATNVACNGANTGTATVNVSGGSPSYTYAWSPSGGTGSTASGLTAGIYSCTATDAAGCTITTTFNITQPPTLSTSTSQVNISCNGGASGSATVNASGGAPSYSYSWDPSGGNAATASNLTAGTYTCTVTDANGCFTSEAFNLTQPAPLSSVDSQVDLLCNGGNTGSASVNVSGGNLPYTYSWSPIGGNAATASSLPAGNYSCTITDANACSTTQTFSITQPPALSAAVTSIDATCGNANGSATVNVSGGTASYAYAWTPSGGTNATASSLIAGNYACTITDANGCSITTSVNITNTSGPTASVLSSGNISCAGGNNGSISVGVSGGSPGFTYSWNPAGGNSSTASSLSAGSYTCTITDANGCITNASATLTEPAPLNVTSAAVSANCNQSDGSATATVSGGTSSYTYSWSPSGGNAATATGIPAGTYTCDVTDANGCTANTIVSVGNANGPNVSLASFVDVSCFGGSNGAATANVSGGSGPYTYAWTPSGGNSITANGLAAGTYTCSVTDNNGCVNSTSVTITAPAQLSGTISSTPSNCSAADGSAAIVISGGVPNYVYNWSPSGGTNATANTISSGTYTVNVTDNNGCTFSQTVNVTQQNTNIASVASSTNESCFGGSSASATVTPGNGNSPYSYSWSSGGSNATENNLAIGTYTCTITDANGCTGTQTVSITQPSQLTATSSSTNENCFGGSTGSASVSVSGGTTSYAYNWQPTGGNSSSASGLTAGSYTCVITDANGCSLLQIISVTQPTAITATSSSTAAVCYGTSTGNANVNANGGTPGYTYAWSPAGGTGAAASSLAAGNYSCTITDANGCTFTQTQSVTQPTAVSVVANGDNSCAGANGQLSATSTGGTGPYSYLWSNGISGSSQNVIVNSTTAFTVTATDANGCTGSATASVTVVPAPVASFTSNAANGYFNPSSGPLCFTDASAAAVSWNWDLNGNLYNQQSPPCITLTNADTGSFCTQLVVVNNSGCTDTTYACIEIMNSFMTIPNVFTPNSDGTNDVFIPAAQGISEFSMEIYDRWGVLMSRTASITQGWDGRNTAGMEATDGTYYYVVHAVAYDTTQYDLKGFLTLIR